MKNAFLEENDILAMFRKPHKYFAEKTALLTVTESDNFGKEKLTISAGILNNVPYVEIMDANRIVCACEFQRKNEGSLIFAFGRIGMKIGVGG